MIQFSYEDILQRLRENLQKRLENTGLLFFSTNQKILEAVAEELSEEMRYDEYLTNESKWVTAQNKTSLMNQVEFFNYDPHRKRGSEGFVVISGNSEFNGSYPRTVLVPKFTQFSSEDMKFASVQSVNLLSNQTSVEIPVVQGAVKTSEFEITPAFSSSELIGLELEEDNPDIDDIHYEVRVNGEVWSEIESFSLSPSSNAKVFMLRNKPDFSGIRIVFGDGESGRKLNYEDIVTFTYVETLGSIGEVLQTNVIDTIDSILRDSAGNEVDLYCKNEEAIVGGEDYESLESIRINAPRNLDVSTRVITTSDYQTFLLDFGLVDKLTVWGEVEYNNDKNLPAGTYIPSMENVINITALNYSNEQVALNLTQGQKTQIREALVPVKSLTDLVNFSDPKITFLNFIVTAYYNENSFDPNQVEDAVLNALETAYDIRQTSFKQNLYFSQYYELLSNLAEVEYHETSIELAQYIKDIEIDYIFYIETLYQNMYPNSFKIYVKNFNNALDDSHPHKDWFLIGTDDGAGAIVGEEVPDYFSPDPDEVYDIGSSNSGFELRYPYGSFSDNSGDAQPIKIANGMEPDEEDNYQIRIVFQSGKGVNGNVDVIPTQRRQIFAFESVETETDALL